MDDRDDGRLSLEDDDSGTTSAAAFSLTPSMGYTGSTCCEVLLVGGNKLTDNPAGVFPVAEHCIDK
jgi:hypothetical protein